MSILDSKRLKWTELGLIFSLAIIPLFIKFPYRVNIFLTWEGAYRISNGQWPFIDFGAPVGGVFWLVPSIFFTIFGPQFISLIKAQVLLNIISGISFRSILINLKYPSHVRFLALVVFIISYSFPNFWPWYNHTVIVYQLVSLALTLNFVTTENRNKYSLIWLIASAVFASASFFTKQDGGAFTIFICILLLSYNSIIDRSIKSIMLFLISFCFVSGLYIYPLLSNNFGYWFNYGQSPHSSRVSIYDIFQEFFAGSQWIKFYLFLITVTLLPKINFKINTIKKKDHIIPLILTLSILAEAVVLQVTSYTPPDNNIFFHSFAIAFILSQLSLKYDFSVHKIKSFSLVLISIIFIWSQVFWKYTQRFLPASFKPQIEKNTSLVENIVTRQNFVTRQANNEINPDLWKESNFVTLKNIKLPIPTIEGINRIMQIPGVKNNPNLRVLNMSELTFLAKEIPYKLEKGNNFPLWYHLGVSMFNKDAAFFENRVKNKFYDLILFEYIPNLNNFYPFRVRDSIRTNYKIIDQFPAPRTGDTQGMIEVYLPN